MIYEFWCDTCEEITAFKHTMKEGPPFMPLCFECEVPMQRIYALPQLITSYESAADVMNKALAGQGDPMPGMTRAQTQHTARMHLDAVKKNKGGKSSNAAHISYPGGGDRVKQD